MHRHPYVLIGGIVMELVVIQGVCLHEKRFGYYKTAPDICKKKEL